MALMMRSRWQQTLPCLKQLVRISSRRSVSVSTSVCGSLYNSSTCDLTSSEALRALRPFYLAVHPDLFRQHPRERSTNEDSLKKLNSYLDALVVVSGCGQDRSGAAVRTLAAASRPKPIQLTFFVRARQADSLKAVSVSLDAHSIASAVHDILQSCDLFADISNSTISKLLRTKHEESEKHRVLSTYSRYKSHQHRQPEPLQDYPDFDYMFSERAKTGSEHVQERQPESLETWLKENLPLARSRLDSSKCLREENESLKERICSRHGLQSLSVTSDWTAATAKGHLLSLEKALEIATTASLVEGSQGDGDGLRVALGHSQSFVSVHGEVHLSCEETIQQWLQYLVGCAPAELEIVRQIDSLEEELLKLIYHRCERNDYCSTRLILKRPSTTTPAVYHSQLAENLIQCKQETPPHNLQETPPNNQQVSPTNQSMKNSNNSDTNEVTITIVDKSGTDPLLLENGIVEVPSGNCSLSALGEFLEQNRHRIIDTRRNHKRSVDEMVQAVQNCKQKLSLSDLTVKANVSNEQIKSCCQRLLPLGSGSEDLNLKEHYLSLTNSYSVSSDGVLKIPWDFAITSSNS